MSLGQPMRMLIPTVSITHLTITNLHNYRQFGNLLVLSAAYRSNELRHLIPSHVLASLFSKTIYFFRTLSPISAALRKDLQILEHTASKLDLNIDTVSW